jgi:hypothetical protein
MQRTLIVGLILSVVTLACPAGASACGELRHSHAVRRPDRAGRAPLLIGDSTSIIAAPVLGRLGIEADAHGCRQFGQGVAMLAARRHARTLPHVVVLALGANGPISTGQIGAALRITGPHRVLALVTARRSAATDAAMHRSASRHRDRVLLIDWVRYSAGHGGWFAGDGLHVNHEGASAYAHLIKDAVAPLAFPPVADLKMPARAAGTTRCGAVQRAGRRYRVYVTLRKERIPCARARTLARTGGLRVQGWRVYDWQRTGNGPWDWVLAREDHEVVVGLVAA